MTISISEIAGCDAEECAYNKEGRCHTIAITVGSKEAYCDTFLPKGRKGGADDMLGGVGACKMDNCAFNQSFECSAKGINVRMHGKHADCATFQAG